MNKPYQRKSIKCLKKFFILLMFIFCIILQGENNKLEAQSFLSMDRAVGLAVKNNSDLVKVNASLKKKYIDLGQAREGLNDIRRKESSMKYSPLVNLSFGESHAMPKEIDMVIKIPNILTEINKIVKEKENVELKVRYETQNQYLKVIADEINVESYAIEVRDEEENLKKLKRSFLLGEATKEKVEKKELEIEEAKKKYIKAVLDYENNKEELGDKIGMNILNGYSFERNLRISDINLNDLASITEKSRNKNLEVYNKNVDYTFYESKFQSIRQIYESRFGSKVSIIEEEINKSVDDIDYEVFMEKYQYMLDAIQSKWNGNFTINLLFFSISFPKEWLMDKYDGLRYFENEKYALPISIQERKIAKLDYDKAVKDHDKMVKEGYNNLNEMKKAYLGLVKQCKALEIQYKETKNKNLKGEVTFEEADSAKKGYRDAMKSALSMLIEYNKQLYSYNFQTSGISNQIKSSTGVIEIKSLDSPVSFEPKIIKNEMVKEKSTKLEDYKWYIFKSDTDYKVNFKISVPKISGITHYQLYDSTMREIGDKKKSDEVLSHLPIVFNDSTKLYLKLYKGGTPMYLCELIGIYSEGDLVIKDTLEEVEDVIDLENESKYKIENFTDKTSKLSLILNDELNEVATYSIIDKESKKGFLIDEISKTTVKKSIDEEFIYLTAVLNDYLNLEVILFDKDDNEIGKGQLLDDGILEIKLN